MQQLNIPENEDVDQNLEKYMETPQRKRLYVEEIPKITTRISYRTEVFVTETPSLGSSPVSTKLLSSSDLFMETPAVRKRNWSLFPSTGSSLFLCKNFKSLA